MPPVAPSAHRFTGLSLGANLTSPLARPDLRQHPSGTEPARKNSSVLRKKPPAGSSRGLADKVHSPSAKHRPPSDVRFTAQFSVAGLGSAPLPVPLSGRVLRMAKAAVDLSAFTWRHLFRFAERLIVVGIRSVPRSSLGKNLPPIAGSAFSAMNSNTLVGLVLKNPEIHAQPPLSSPCQNDANRNKSDRPHATAKSSDTVMASSVKPPFQSDQMASDSVNRSSFIGKVGYGRSRRCRG